MDVLAHHTPPQLPPLTPEQVRGPQEEVLSPYTRLRLGGDEFALCGAIDLGVGGEESSPDARIVILDVGFRGKEGEYGPYDIDGSGEKRTFAKPYVLMTQEQTAEGILTHIFEVDETEPIPIGREADSATALGLQSNLRVSRKHAVVSISKGGSITVQDVGSTNGTKARSASELIGTSTTEYGYTYSLDDFVHRQGVGHRYKNKSEAVGWGNGEYAGRPIIARDTPINGGVYPVGGQHGEALVVDDKKYPKELNAVYEQVLSAIDNVDEKGISFRGLRNRIFAKGKSHENQSLAINMLENVFSVVYDTLEYDIEATDALASDSQKISLNSYISHGVGVCRTQAVLTAYVIERLIDEGKLNGRVSIDRNMDHDVQGGHAWARYVDEGGQVYIVDPAQRFVGTLAETYTRENTWDYRRSEDMVKQMLAA